MKLLKGFFISIFIISIFIFVSSSNSQTADDIIDKYVTAIGGMDKINSVQTVFVTAKFSGMGMDIPVTETVKRPDKVREEMTFQGQLMTRAYDGTTAWGTNPFSGSKDAEKMNAEETKDMKERANFFEPFIGYKDMGSTVEFLGKEDMEGTDVNKLKLTDKDGDITTYYFDANSGLLLKATGKRKMKEKEITFSTSYGDYKDESGLLIAHSLDISSDASGMGSQKIILDKVEFNTAVDDSIFVMPETK